MSCTKRAWLCLLSVALALSAAPACSRSSGIRLAPYPLGFERIDHSELRTEMRAIAHGLLDVESALHTSAGTVDRPKLVAGLRSMEAALSSVRSGALHSDHPVLDEALPRFQQDVRAAREAAEHDPPNDYLAAGVVGACRYCHR